MSFHFQRINSPIGAINLVARGNVLRALIFGDNWETFKRGLPHLEEEDTEVLSQTKEQLSEYFAKKRRSFEIAIELTGTEFQKRTWEALALIPFGEVRTYKQQAELLNAPKAVRAVGRTNGLNPLAIILPCHRVIGSNGSLTGYRGGLKAKEFLLNLERNFD